MVNHFSWDGKKHMDSMLSWDCLVGVFLRIGKSLLNQSFQLGWKKTYGLHAILELFSWWFFTDCTVVNHY